MIERFIKLSLAFLLVFTPLSAGSMEVWASSVMELGILLMILLWAVGSMRGQKTEIGLQQFRIPMIMILGFLALVIFQMVPLPPKMMEIISPKTYEVHQRLFADFGFMHASSVSLVPYATRIELLKWITLGGLFLLLLCWRPLGDEWRTVGQLTVVIILVGSFESLYGMYQFFSRVTQASLGWGTFVNRNYFAGYLLMVIPLGVGFLLSGEARHIRQQKNWLHHISTLDGKGVLIGFAIVVMILGLLLSASRMGILSLLISFTLIMLFLSRPGVERRFSRKSALILGLAILWGAWVGLDAVISRFLVITDDLNTRSTVWEGTLQIVKDFPILGSGLGTFMYVFPMYRVLHVRGLVTHAENDFLQLASDVGLVGAGILLILFIFLIYRAVSGIRRLPLNAPGRYIGIGALVGILGLMIHSLAERNIQVPANAFLWTFLWTTVLRLPTGSSYSPTFLRKGHTKNKR